ncbi:hypothetical protein V8E55_008492 [Tylopilus felleus]
MSLNLHVERKMGETNFCNVTVETEWPQLATGTSPIDRDRKHLRCFDMDWLVVTDLASQASIEHSRSGMCSTEPNAFQVKDLVIELELPEVLWEPFAYNKETLGKVLKEFLMNICSHIAQLTVVIIQGCAPALRLRLSKMLMALQFGDLGQRCQSLDGVLLANAMDSSDGTRKMVHHIMMLDTFMDLVLDIMTCWNYLDDVLKGAVRQSEGGTFSEAAIAMVCLEEVISFLSLPTLYDKDLLTNDEHPGYLHTLPKHELSRRKVLLDANNTSSFTDEDWGEMAFAVECTEWLLTWMNITFEEAKQFIQDQGPYYSGGVEQVEIPALVPALVLQNDTTDIMSDGTIHFLVLFFHLTGELLGLAAGNHFPAVSKCYY